MSENLPPPGGGKIAPEGIPVVDSSTPDILSSDLNPNNNQDEIEVKAEFQEIAPAGVNNSPNPSGVNFNGTSKIQSSQIALRTPTALIAQESVPVGGRSSPVGGRSAPVGGRNSPSIPPIATRPQSRNNSLEDWKFITANSRIVVLPDPRIHTLISSDADDLSSTGTSDHVTGKEKFQQCCQH